MFHSMLPRSDTLSDKDTEMLEVKENPEGIFIVISHCNRVGAAIIFCKLDYKAKQKKISQ